MPTPQERATLYGHWLSSNRDKKGTDEWKVMANGYANARKEMGVDVFSSVSQDTGPRSYPKKVEQQEQPAIDRTIGGHTLEFAKAIPRGAISTVTSGLSGAVAAGDTLLLGSDLRYDDNRLVESLDRFQMWLQEDSPIGVNPAYADTKTVMFGHAFGSVGGFLGTGLLGTGLRGVGLLSKTGKAAGAIDAVVGWGAALGTGADEQRIRMEKMISEGWNVSKADQNMAMFAGSLIGLTERAPIESWLKGVPRKGVFKPMAEEVLNGFVSAGAQALLEGGQEAFAAIAQDLTSKLIYNPEQPIGESMWDEFLAGGFAGALLDGVGTAYNVAERNKALRQIYGNKSLVGIENQLRKDLRDYGKKEIGIATLAKQQRAKALAEQGLQENGQPPAPAPADPSSFKVAGAKSMMTEARKVRLMLGDVFPKPKVDYTQAPKVPSPVDSIGMPNEEFVVKTGEETLKTTRRAKQQQKVSTFIVVDSNGKQYGDGFRSARKANEFAFHLNREIYKADTDAKIQRSLASMKVKPENVEALETIGTYALDPEINTIDAATLNVAAGTTVGKGYRNAEMSVLDLMKLKGKARVNPKNYTAAQKINAKRLANGLEETDSFTVEEVSEVLGKDLGPLAQLYIDSEVENGPMRPETGSNRYKPVQNRLGGWQIVDEKGNVVGKSWRSGKTTGRGYKLDKNTAAKYARLLNNNYGDYVVEKNGIITDKPIDKQDFGELLVRKNIDSEVSSPEINALVKLFTGKESFSKLNKKEKRLVYNRFAQFPALSALDKLPVFDQKYLLESERADLAKKLEEEKAKNKKTTAYEKEKNDLVKQLSKVLSGLAPKSGHSIELTEGKVRNALMTESGEVIPGVRLRKNGEEIIEWGQPVPEGNTKPVAYDPDNKTVKDDTVIGDAVFDEALRKIFVSYESAVEIAKKRNGGKEPTAAGIEDVLVEQLTHETVHMLRLMDMWTSKEWELLTHMASTLKRSNSETYYDYAKRVYGEDPRYKNNEDAIIEEAIVAMTVDYRRNPKLLKGKPRGLINRLIDFVRRIRSFMAGNGYRNMNDIMKSFYSGEVGARQQDVVRTGRFVQRDISKMVAAKAALGTDDGRELVPDENGIVVVRPKPEMTPTETRDKTGRLRDFYDLSEKDTPAMYMSERAEADVIPERVLDSYGDIDFSDPGYHNRMIVRAFEMYNKHLPNKEIRRETGFFFGDDGKVRFEISDHRASIATYYKANTYDMVGNNFFSDWRLLPKAEVDRFKAGGTRLGDALIHPVLYKGYPALAEARLYRTYLGEGVRGYMSPMDNVIVVSSSLGEEETLSTLLHEVQHWIQANDGLAEGGNPESAARVLLKELGEAKVIKQVNDEFDEATLSLSSAIEDGINKVEEFIKHYNFLEMNGKYSDMFSGDTREKARLFGDLVTMNLDVEWAMRHDTDLTETEKKIINGQLELHSERMARDIVARYIVLTEDKNNKISRYVKKTLNSNGKDVTFDNVENLLVQLEFFSKAHIAVNMGLYEDTGRRKDREKIIMARSITMTEDAIRGMASNMAKDFVDSNNHPEGTAHSEMMRQKKIDLGMNWITEDDITSSQIATIAGSYIKDAKTVINGRYSRKYNQMRRLRDLQKIPLKTIQEMGELVRILADSRYVVAAYEALAGEQEARDTQARMKMNMNDRSDDPSQRVTEGSYRYPPGLKDALVIINYPNVIIKDMAAQEWTGADELGSRPELTNKDIIGKIPFSFMKRIKVNVPSTAIDGQIVGNQVDARQAIADVEKESQAYEALLSCVTGG